MQCKPVAELPTGEKWVFEIKLDGYRCIAVKQGKEIALFSRHKKVLNRRFPGVVDALASLKGDFDLDGELVVLDLEGRSSFQLLHGAVSASLPTHFYAFDVLDKNGELLGDRPFRSAEQCWKVSWPVHLKPLRVSPLLQAPIKDSAQEDRKRFTTNACRHKLACREAGNDCPNCFTARSLHDCQHKSRPQL
jgi:ATP-dependent DNA ligase